MPHQEEENILGNCENCKTCRRYEWNGQGDGTNAQCKCGHRDIDHKLN